MEEHDDDLMLGEDDHNLHHDEDENNHEIHHEDEEHMDIEPNRIEGVSTSSPAPLDRDEFWDREPTKEEIWEVGFFCAFLMEESNVLFLRETRERDSFP